MAMHFVLFENSTTGAWHYPKEIEITRAIRSGDARLDEKKICDDCFRQRLTKKEG